MVILRIVIQMYTHKDMYDVQSYKNEFCLPRHQENLLGFTRPKMHFWANMIA